MKSTITTYVFLFTSLAIAQQDSHRTHLSARHPSPNSQYPPNLTLFRRKTPSPSQSPSPPRSRPQGSINPAQNPNQPGPPTSPIASNQAGRGRFNPPLPWVPRAPSLLQLPQPQGLPPLSREGPAPLRAPAPPFGVPAFEQASPRAAAGQAQLVSDVGSIVRANEAVLEAARAARAARAAHMRQPGQSGQSGQGAGRGEFPQSPQAPARESPPGRE